jgi:polygalacturonase
MSYQASRREVLKASAAAGAGALAVPLAARQPARGGGGPGSRPPAPGMAGADDILRRVRAPQFPDATFDITDYGAVGDGTTDCTKAIAAAIAACSLAGGGHVVVPPGTFLTGAIHLRSFVDLHLERGSTLLFSTDPASYLPVVFTRWQGIEYYGYSPFVYAFMQENVGVTGEGTLDGQASDKYWWPWKGQEQFGWSPGQPNQNDDWNALTVQARDNVPVYQRVYGAGHYLRPVFLQFMACHDVVISGVTIINSPNWEVVPDLSRNVLIENITVRSLGPNNDGCDIESCTDVVVTGCTFDTGDDCVAIKAGRDTDARRVSVPCRNVVITDCAFANGHGGVTIGSEMTAGVANVYARNITMTSPDIDDALRIKTNPRRGGYVRNVYVDNVTVTSVTTAGVHVNFYYGTFAGYDYKPVVENINVSNMSVGSCEYAVYLNGLPGDPITGVSLTDCDFARAAEPNYIENAEDVTFRNVRINGKPAAG